MRNIVHIQNHDLKVSIQDMADFSGTKFRSIEKLLTTHEEYFELLGLEVKEKGKYRDFKSQFLNEPQATFLITLMRNTENVAKFKISLVMQFFKMREALCDATKYQIETKDNEIKQLKERGYAKPRAGDFQLVDRIRQDYNIQASTHDLNKLLEDNMVLVDEPYWKSNFLPNEESDFSIKQGKSTLVYTSTLLSLVDEVGIVRLLGHEDINQRLF